jgi:hypothetical protein
MYRNEYRRTYRRRKARLQKFLEDSSCSDADELNASNVTHRTSDSVSATASENADLGGNISEEFFDDLSDCQFGFNGGRESSNSEPDVPIHESDTEHSEDTVPDFSCELKDWVHEFNIPGIAMTSLLHKLRRQGHRLPMDSRTLLDTPRSVAVTDQCGGKFKYYGIANGVSKIVAQHKRFWEENASIDLQFNIDGVPLFKSTGAQFWPILCRFHTFEPFLVALFHGSSKPSPLEDYLEDLLKEIKTVTQTGLIVDGKHFTVNIQMFICDAPARSYLKQIKNHSAYFACERCTMKGTYESSRIIFTSGDVSSARTDEEFATFTYKHHQHRPSILAEAGLSCVTTFVLDYMHLVCLGVVKRILTYFKQGPRECRLSFGLKQQLSDKLLALSGHLPSNFARQPRSYFEFERWKATELRQFLLYTGPVVLKDIVSEKVYQHFLTLSVAMTILLDEDTAKRNRNIGYARELLAYFVTESPKVYSPTFCVYNVHNLLHIADDVEKFQMSLNGMSAFPFENHLQRIKKMVRNSKSPVVQVSKRLKELESAHQNLQFRCVNQGKRRISAGQKDHCYILEDSSYVFVREKREQGYVCDVVNNTDLQPFFEKPCSSMLIHVAIINNLDRARRRLIPRENLTRKGVCLPYRGGFVVSPMLHME